MPYHAMRRGPIDDTKDPRRISGIRLRKSEPLPLRSDSRDQEDLYYHEAQTSSLSWGPDETFWSELFLVDTYFGSEKNRETYLDTPRNGSPGDGSDPPLGGRGSMKVPMFDPREYFLMKVDRRIEQVATEYGALVETFNKRMEEYVSDVVPLCTVEPDQITKKSRRPGKYATFLWTTHKELIQRLSATLSKQYTFSSTVSAAS
jgi:hypothetical protein